MRLRILISTLAILWCHWLHAQQSISAKPIVYGYHPFADPNNEIAPKSIGLSGTFAIEPGLIFGYENYFINPFMGANASTGVYVDNAFKISGFLHLGFSARTFTGNQSFSISVGPSFYYRQTWDNVEGYVDDGLWNSGSSLQTKFSLFTGELEYAYAINKQHNITFSFTQINPRAFTFSLGYTFWMRKANPYDVKYKKRPKNFSKRRRR